MDVKEFMECRMLRFEWTLRGVGELFDASKGEAKSKCIKSALFGGGRWQVIFYANSGTINAEGSGFVSLYLSAEPTIEEKESTVHGSNRWVREGSYTFGFELRNTQRNICFQTKEARNHTFSYKTVNWGWAQFARRDAVYYTATTVRGPDSFLIICTITETPTPPVPPSPSPHQLVPKDLLTAMGSLLDDPIYSDVEFVLPKRHSSKGDSKPKIIYASKKLLTRVDYFDTMFQSGFAEATSSAIISGDRPLGDGDSSVALTCTEITDTTIDDDMDAMSTVDATSAPKFEDSDDEDDYNEFDPSGEDRECEDEADSARPQLSLVAVTAPIPNDTMTISEQQESEHPSRESSEGDDLQEPDAGEGGEVHDRNVQRKLSHPSSPRSEAASLAPEDKQEKTESDNTGLMRRKEKPVPGLNKARVVVKDAPYATYFAVLHYIYTDTIVFAPLASSFPSYAEKTLGNRSEGHVTRTSDTPSSRREWISTWRAANPGKPRPCSAKAVYRLADRLDLQELKGRAFEHIIKSLTVDNVAYEVFSHFSAAFDDVRKVEINYFLEHWADIRDSSIMRNIWQQIRMGRHPGFEEVWPLIATNLEYKPKEPEPAPRDSDKS